MLRYSLIVILTTQICFAMSIQEAWIKTQEHNQGLKAEEYHMKRAEKLRSAAQMAYLPQVDLVGFYTRLSDSAVLEPDPSMLPPQITHNPQLAPLLQSLHPVTLIEKNVIIGAVHAVLPLYTGGARRAMNSIAEIGMYDAKEQYRLKQLLTFEELVKVYYAVLLQKELRNLLIEQEQSTLDHYHNAIRLKQAGQIAQVELLSTQVAHDKAKNATKTAEDNFEVAKLALDTILEHQNSTPTSALIVQGELKEMDFYIDQTLLAYPALKNIHNKYLQAKEFSRLQVASFLPQVALEGAFIATDDKSVIEKGIPQWYAGIGIRIPLISPQGRPFKYQAAKMAELQVSSLEAQAISDIRLLVQKTYKEAKAAKEQHESLVSSIALAKENLLLQEKAFSQGIATQVQVNDARNMLLGAEVEQKSVAYKYIVLLAKLMALSNNIDGFFSMIGEQ